MNRIYVRLSNQLLTEDDKARYFLSYLKIRAATKLQNGGFFFKKFCDILDLSPRAARTHLKKLLKSGYIIQQTKTHYKVVSQKKLFKSFKKEVYLLVSDDQLKAFSSKKIASFRAFLAEIRYECSERYKRAKIKGYSVINQKDKSRERVRNASLRAMSNRIAISYAADLTGFCQSTIIKYRKLQTVVKYHWKLQWMNIPKGTPNSPGRELCGEELLGKYFFWRGKLVFSPISIRKNAFDAETGEVLFWLRRG